MSQTLPTYAPPMLKDGLLKAKLLEWFPSHKGTEKMLSELVEEYKRLWRMILSRPERKVVAPRPLMVVQKVHQTYKGDYFDDCLKYFNKYVSPGELAWQGPTDHKGALDTITVYHELFRTDPPVAWVDMSKLFLDSKKASGLRLV